VRDLASTVATQPPTTDIVRRCHSAEDGNVCTAGAQPGAGHTGSGQSSGGNTLHNQEQEPHKETSLEQAHRSERLTGHTNTLSTPKAVLARPISRPTLNSGQNHDGGTLEISEKITSHAADAGTAVESAVADSTASRTQSPRQAALRARKRICGQSERDATAKRRKRVEIGSAETETVSTLASQVANPAALATTREVVNNADRITELNTYF
jgi:hypothetical protein